MSDNPTNINLKLALEQAALTQSATGVDAIKAKFAALKAEAQSAGRVADGALGDIASSAKDGVGAVRDLDTALAKTSKTLEQVSKNSKGLNVEGLRRTGGALSQLGLGEVGSLVSRAGDVGQIGKEIGSLVGSLGALGPVAIAAAGAIAGFTIGIKLADRAAEDAKRNLEAAISTQKHYYDLVATATTEQVEAERARLKKVMAAQQLAQDETERSLKRLEDQTHISRNVGIAAPGALGDEFRSLTKQLDENKKSVSESDIAIGRLNGGLLSGAFAVNDLEEKLNKLSGAAESASKGLEDAWDRFMAAGKKLAEKQATDQIAALEDQVRAEDKYRELSKTMSSQQLEDELDADNKRMIQNRLLIDSLQALDDPTGKNAEKIKELTAQNEKLYASDQKLVEITGPLIAAREKEADAIERNKRVADVQAKYEDAVKSAEQHSLEQRAEIQKKYNDKLVDIAREAADAAANALKTLTRASEDLGTGLLRDLEKSGRDEAIKRQDIRINAAREEEKAAREHVNRLEQIRKDAANREIGFLLDRNFLGLLQSRMQTTADIGNENTSFTQQTSERKTAETQQLNDLQRSITNERNERLIAYQQSLADARIAYNRELEDARAKRMAELNLARATRDEDLKQLAAKSAQEQRILYNNYTQALKLASAYGAQYLKLQDQIQAGLVRRATATLAALSGGSSSHELAHRAGGGMLDAGQASTVNEPGSGGESFGGVKFPNLPGIFIASKAGYVSPGGGGKGNNNPLNFYITSHDPMGVKLEVLNLLEDILQ